MWLSLIHLFICQKLTNVSLQNFVISIVAADLEQGTIYRSPSGNITNIPSDSGALGESQDALNLFFTISFTVELVLNIYAKSPLPFVRSGWNILDFITVAISLVGLAPVGLPVSLILSIRAIRVVRLFGKIKSLKKMLTAFAFSVPPMMNAFSIIFIIASICKYPPKFHDVLSLDVFRPQISRISTCCN